MTHHCAVIGNPIAHSRSPEIHAGFAAARGIDLRYERILAADEADFAAIVARFFADGGRGLNVTVPYKQTAYRLCERTTLYAAAAEAVNTLWMENGKPCKNTALPSPAHASSSSARVVRRAASSCRCAKPPLPSCTSPTGRSRTPKPSSPANKR